MATEGGKNSELDTKLASLLVLGFIDYTVGSFAYDAYDFIFVHGFFSLIIYFMLLLH